MILPNFLIIGAPRCSTTSLHEWLGQHPDFFMCSLKEPSYYGFEEGSPRNQAPYPDQFVHCFAEYAPLFAKAAGHKIVGESSTLYLQVPEAPARISAAMPDVKMVAVLRDPADRCFSHYLQHRYVCAERVTTFREALDDLPRRRAAGWTVNWDYVEPGFYAKHLRNFYDVFGADRIKIFLFDEVKANPQQVLDQICRFVGASESFPFNTSAIHNESGVPRSGALANATYRAMRKLTGIGKLVPGAVRSPIANKFRQAVLEKPALAPADRAYLIDIYRDDIRKLGEMLGLDLGAWLRPRGEAESSPVSETLPDTDEAIPST